MAWRTAKRALAAALTVAVMAAGGAAAQETVERSGAQKDWSVFQLGAGDEKVCWISSAPTKWEARRGGGRAEVNRGDIFLNVSVRPAEGVENEVSMVAGYPFRDDSTVRVDIGSETFAMFTEGDKAWLESPEADARMVQAMKRGVDAVLTGTSGRGTTTIDTFSLIGFTAALAEAQRLCG